MRGTILHDSLESLFEKVWATLSKPLFRKMLDLRGSFLSGIPAQKHYGVYREFIKVIQEAIEGRKTLRLLYRAFNLKQARPTNFLGYILAEGKLVYENGKFLLNG